MNKIDDILFTLIELKRAATAGTFTGLASTWSIDREHEAFAPGAFTKTLSDFRSNGGRIPLLYKHQQDRPLGSISSAEETSKGLLVSGEIAIDTADGAEAYALLKRGALSMSVGFLPQPNGVKTVGDRRVFTAVDLLEISLVAVPANPEAVITSVKYLSRADLEHAARDKLQISRNQAKALAAIFWPAYSKTEPEPEVKPKTPSPAALAALKAFTQNLKR